MAGSRPSRICHPGTCANSRRSFLGSGAWVLDPDTDCVGGRAGRQPRGLRLRCGVGVGSGWSRTGCQGLSSSVATHRGPEGMLLSSAPPPVCMVHGGRMVGRTPQGWNSEPSHPFVPAEWSSPPSLLREMLRVAAGSLQFPQQHPCCLSQRTRVVQALPSESGVCSAERSA